MSECKGLSQYKAYNLDSVRYDAAAKAYVLQINDPPDTCKDGVFITHSGQLVENTSLPGPILTYTDHPVITVPNKGLVTTINQPVSNPVIVGNQNAATTSGHGVLFWLVIAALIAGAIWFFRKLFKSTTDEDPEGERVSTPSFGGGGGGGGYHYSPSFSRPVNPPAQTPAQHTTTVINNGSTNSGVGDFVTGAVVGSLLTRDRDEDRPYRHYRDEDAPRAIPDPYTVIPDSPRTPEPTPQYSSDRDDSVSSDSGSSFGSDSGSTYGSDSGGSYDSDSGGSFGSDSGGSFGSDSGGSFGGDTGGSFGSD